MSHSPNTLYIFRQDLRIHDNTWRQAAIEQSSHILPIFIFDTNVLSHFPNNDTRIGFLFDALKHLDEQLHKHHKCNLQLYYGDSTDIIPSVCTSHDIQHVFMNESYGYGAMKRDVILAEWYRNHNISLHTYNDFLVVPIDKVPVRKVFTPFFKLREKEIVSNPTYITLTPTPSKKLTPPQSHAAENISFEDIKNILHISENTHRPIHMWEKRVADFDFVWYNDTRNFPYIDGSSKLSAYIRFGIISIRELYQKALSVWATTYISELARREFRHHIFFHFPATRHKEFQEKRRYIQRDNNELFFTARKNGMTGYPMVDAWMRQLLTENRMHNRVRMVVASFLTKDLIIDRRWWEKHFADYLLDYDTNVNIGNRQWAASVWADPKPLRIFSPMLQSERFDPNCEYIKKRIPELRDFSPKEIHNPLECDLSQYRGKKTWYPRPIINHYERSKKAKEIYMESGNKKDI